MKNLLLRALRFGEGRKIRELQAKVEAVNAWEPQISELSDEELVRKTSEFKQRFESGEALESLLPEAFAVVREVAKRTINMRHFDVQIMGGVVLYEGKIAEMKTGEGKTLVATLPVYLNALEGKGAHIVTVNDYLAKRDSEWMGPIYKFLGLNVGLIQAEMDPGLRKVAYDSDVTYGTNNEFGFDYLRDNMTIHPDQRVQRGHPYAIVDEVDSILIDEARTPLIISGPAEKRQKLYEAVNRVVANLKGTVIAKEDKEKLPALEERYDYIANEKEHTVKETRKGQERIATALRIDADKLFGGEDFEEDKGQEMSLSELELIYHLRSIIKQSILAHTLFKKDRDYVVKDGEVIIVDEFTGRLMIGRRYSEGLHQAIEAKERVKIREENQTLATITLQNYFRMYEKLAGMTGTAATEADEFMHIYKLETVVILTNMPMIRKDISDVIYKNEEIKFDAVVDDIVRRYKKGQPILIGTVSIEKSERLSKKLKRKGIPHQVLNAKHHEKEAHIVAQAGRKGAVTVATNMAGRGVDILLGGNPDGLINDVLRKRSLEPGKVTPEQWAEAYKEARELCNAERKEILGFGGLHVMGTERHEARRIDNQLRGRSGRQGDPGSSQFYLSLEDDLMRLFGSHRIGAVMERMGLPDEQPIEHSLITRSIETAQKQVESQNFSIRKHVLEYDDVMNKQREIIYAERNRILDRKDLHDQTLDIIFEVVENTVKAYTHPNTYAEEWDWIGLMGAVNELFPHSLKKEELDLHKIKQEELIAILQNQAEDAYVAREEELSAEVLRELERLVMLQVVDTRWREHLYEMDYLKEGIGLRAIGQRNPLIEYKNEAFAMFQNMIAAVKEDFAKYIFHLQIIEEERPQTFLRVPTETSQPVTQQSAPKKKKVGRNDPCPCGSGKKYKKCHGR